MRAGRLKAVGAWTVAIAAAVLLCACQQGARVDAGLPVYPTTEQVKEGRVLDVQVVREETIISFSNTTAMELPAGRLWVNRWFSREFDGLAVGASTSMSLGEFKDPYGESFRAGGFFATQRPTKLSLVQLEHDGVMDGFITASRGD